MTWVIATYTLAMAPQLINMPALVIACTLAPLLWRILAEIRHWKPPSALLRYGATGIGLASLFVSYGGFAGRRAAVSLLTLMLALKFLECYRIRDARLLVSFTLFLACTQFLFHQGILMPVYGVAVLSGALVALSSLQREEAWQQQGEAPDLSLSVLSELGFSFKLLAMALPVCLAMFLLFPRLASPLWGIPDSSLDGKTGLGDSMSPGSIQSLFIDDSPAFRVKFEGRIPDQSELYWRGPVFWDYDGRTWREHFYNKNVELDEFPAASDNSLDYTVQLEPNERKWLFSLDYPTAAPPETRVTLDYQMIRNRPVIQLMEYRVISSPDHVDTPDLGNELRRVALELPEFGNPRTRELVEQWRRETPGDEAFIRRILEHFNTEDFSYSLEAPLLGNHAVDEFLFDTRLGYCEHYASTFAVMARMAGIPTRIVTGYQGGWFNDMGDYMLVRQSDAHAWTEVWLPGRGWSRVDPTSAVSPDRIQSGSLTALPTPRHLLDFSWFRSVRNSVDIVQQRWNDWVIEYSADRQMRLFAPLGVPRMTPGMLVSVLALVLLGLGFLIMPFILKIRNPASADPAVRCWHTFLAKLRRAGFRGSPAMGPMETVQRASSLLGQQSSAILRIGDLYCRIRYAPDPPGLQEFRSAVKDFQPKRRSV